MSREENLFRLVSKIPKGKVTTYSILAEISGIHPRQVGQLLHENPDLKGIPCHRVVNKKGKVAKNYAFGGAKEQIKKLQEEKVEIKNHGTDLAKYLWNKGRL